MSLQVSAQTEPRNRIEILGILVDRLGMAQTLEKIQDFLVDGTPHVVVTADSSGVVASRTDSELKEIMMRADLVTPDSTGIVWAAKRRGRPLPERVSGVDLVDRICRLSAEKGWRLFFLGSAPGVAETAAEKLRLMHPGCNIVGTRHGYFPADSDAIVANEIAEAKPDVLFVAMGIPRQEKFIWRTRGIIKASVAMGVGGSFDVFSGQVRRAPKLIQNLSMEWAWRLFLNPKKWRKAKALPVFAWLVLRGK